MDITTQSQLDAQLCNPNWATWESLDIMVEYSEYIYHDRRRLDSKRVMMSKNWDGDYSLSNYPDARLQNSN